MLSTASPATGGRQAREHRRRARRAREAEAGGGALLDGLSPAPRLGGGLQSGGGPEALRGYAVLQGDDQDPLDGGEEGGEAAAGFALNAKNVALQLALVAALTAEGLFRKANTTLYMEHYATLLNLALVAVVACVFVAVDVYQRRVSRSQAQPVTRRHVRWYAAIAVFDTAATYMIILSSRAVSAPLATLLSQGVIPVGMLATRVAFGRSFRWQHLAGALVIFAGIAVSVGATAGGDHQGSNFGWAVVFFLSSVPIAVGSVFKEKIMTSERDPAPMVTLNAAVAFLQVWLSLALAPAGYALQEDRGPHGVSHTWANLGNGLECWLLGRNSPDEGAHGDTHCADAVWAVWSHAAVVVLLNAVALAVIFHGSAVMFFIAGASAIPLTDIVSSAGFMGPLQVSFSPLDIAATAATLGGMVLYNSVPEG